MANTKLSYIGITSIFSGHFANKMVFWPLSCNLNLFTASIFWYFYFLLAKALCNLNMHSLQWLLIFAKLLLIILFSLLSVPFTISNMYYDHT